MFRSEQKMCRFTPLINLNRERIMSKENKPKLKKGNCPSCWGKGFYTQMYGKHYSADFVGDKSYDEKPSIHKIPCSDCKGSGKSSHQEPPEEEKCCGKCLEYGEDGQNLCERWLICDNNCSCFPSSKCEQKKSDDFTKSICSSCGAEKGVGYHKCIPNIKNEKWTKEFDLKFNETTHKSFADFPFLTNRIKSFISQTLAKERGDNYILGIEDRDLEWKDNLPKILTKQKEEMVEHCCENCKNKLK